MHVQIGTKPMLFEKAKKVIQLQIDDLQEQLRAIEESANSETKSSAGDKYETQLEMLNQSRDVLNRSLTKSRSLLMQLQNVSLEPKNKVTDGALIKIKLGWVWISIPLGQLTLENKVFHLVSKASPLIHNIWELKEGEEFQFRGNKEKIEQIL